MRVKGTSRSGVVNHRVALPILAFDALGLKAQRTILQRAKLIIEISVDGAAVNNAVSNAFIFSNELAIFGIQQNFRIAEHALNHCGVAAHGNTLPTVVEVVVVVNEANRQALDDGSGQLGAALAPLLFGVALDQLFKYVLADKRKRLLLEVGGLGLRRSARLLPASDAQ